MRPHPRLALALALALSGCGAAASPTGDGDGDGDDAASSDSADSADSAAPSSSATEGGGADDDAADDGPVDADGGDDDDAPGEPLDLDPDAGYLTIPPTSYTLHGTDRSASEARMFYAFQPADDDPDDEAPLLLIFNGGPGAGSGIFFGFNTARQTLDPAVAGQDVIVDNASSWTSLGHCLWLDARLTGFGYGWMDDASNAAARAEQFSVDNFNPWIDAADFVRGLLAFYAAHPELADHPVVLVGESYGGVRASAMLDLLLHAGEHAAGSTGYVDPALVEALGDHFEATLGDPSPSAADAAAQFGRQVLVQPLLVGQAQLAASGDYLDGPDSPLLALGEQVGEAYPPAPAFYSGLDKRQWALDWVEGLGRDTSNVAQPEGWTDAMITEVNTGLRTADVLAQALMVDPAGIVGLAADARSGAFRTIGDAPDYATDLPAHYGALSPWDVYYLSFSRDVFDAFYGADAYALDVEPTSDAFGRVAARNLLYVDTFITNATADVVVTPPAIGPALAGLPEIEWAATGDTSILVQYERGAFGESGAPYRELALRRYEGGAHSVSMTHPAALRDDLADWL